MKALLYSFAKASGLYRIRNTINGRKYLGTASVFRGRFGDHVAKLRKGVHFNWRLQEDFDRYGEDAFLFEIVAIIQDEKERVAFEQEAIGRAFGPKCYNLSIVCPPTNLGLKRSPETRARMSASFKGRVISAEAREKIRIALTGRKATPETRRKLRESHLGTKRSDETRQKMRDGHFLKKLSPEEQEKRARENGERLRTANLGRKASSTTRKKMSESKKGNQNRLGKTSGPQAAEWIAKRVASRKATLEARKLLSTASLG